MTGLCVYMFVEGGFHSDWESSKHRNADISNYIKAIEYVTANGGGWYA